MKRIIYAFLFVVLLGALCSCNYKAKHISIFYYEKNDIFLTELGKKLSDNLTSKQYVFKNYYAEHSQQKQNNQVSSSLNESSLILMNMVDRLASGAVVEKCMKEDIPVIFFNREPLLEDMINYDKCIYVGPDPDKQGSLQVDCAANLFGNPTSLNSKYDLNGDNIIQLVILKGEQGHQDAERRTQSCLTNLRLKGYNVELLSIAVCNWNREEAKTYVSNHYTDLVKNAELILANNDEMAIGAASYLKNVSSSIDDLIPIIGVDATPAGIEAVNSKLLASTIVNDDQGQVDAICNLADIFLNDDLTLADFKYEIKSDKFVYIDSYVYEKN